jgi:hypothetical protein
MTKPTPCQALVQGGAEPDDHCLRGAAAHVAHDLYLLRHAWVGRELRIGWTLWFITARLLMDFFFRYKRTRNSRGTYSDDILAADFLPSGAWKEIAMKLEPEQPAEYGTCRTVANKLSAHLTYSRIHLTAEGSIPPSEAVHDYLLGVAGMWLDSLPPTRRAWFEPWFPMNPSAI